MFDISNELAIWEETLKACGLKNPEFRKELCDHLMADYEKLLPGAASPRQAFEQAVWNIGPVKSLVREYRKTYGQSIARETKKSFFNESVGTLRFYFVFTGLWGTFANTMAAVMLDDTAIRIIAVLGLCFTVPSVYAGSKLERFLAPHNKLIPGLLIYAFCLHVLRFPFMYDILDMKLIHVWNFCYPICFLLYLMKNVKRLAAQSTIPEPG